MEFKHKPVLLEETIEGLKIKEDGIYVDGTLGGAGHSKEILKRLSSKGMLIGIDRDEEALKAAKENLKQYSNVKYVHGNHDEIEEILKKNIIKIDYIENPKDISIFDSINKTDKIVSRFSTVLFQAYSMNKKIVIDNVSDIEQYNKLKEVGYIMIEKEHELLSDIL